MAFAAQVCGGMGAGLNSTASMAVLTSLYPEQREEIMGYFEGAIGLGFLMGLLIGAGLYALGGLHTAVLQPWLPLYIAVAHNYIRGRPRPASRG